MMQAVLVFDVNITETHKPYQATEKASFLALHLDSENQIKRPSAGHFLNEL